MNLAGVEEQRSIKVGTGSTAARQVGDPPCDDLEQGQRAFEFFDHTQLQRLDLAGVFQHVEQHFDFPAGAVPVDQGDGLAVVGHRAVRQQAPFDQPGARTSQSAGVPSCWACAINGIRSASRLATYTKPVSGSAGAISVMRS